MPGGAVGVIRLLLFGFLAILVGLAAPDTPSTSDEGLAERAAQLRAAVDAAATLSDEQKVQAGLRIDEVLAFARELSEVRVATDEVTAAVHAGPARLAELQDEISAAAQSPLPDDIETATLKDLQARLATGRADLVAIQSEMNGRERHLSQLVDQSRSDAGELAEMEKDLSALAARPLEPGIDDILGNVETLWRGARETLLRARSELITARQGSIDLLTELARLERDLLAARVDAIKYRLGALQQEVQTRRQEEAEAAISAAEEKAEGASPGLLAVRSEIAALAREQAGLIAQEAELQRQLERVSRTSERLKRDYERIQQVVELGGASVQVSSLLQKRRKLAPSPEKLRREMLEFQQGLSDGGLRQLELDEVLQELIDDQATLAYLGRTRGLVGEQPGDADKREGLLEIAGVYRRSVLDLWRSYARFLTVLAQLEANTRSLLQESRRHRGFVDDHLLWVPSTEMIPVSRPVEFLKGLRWYVDGDSLHLLLGDLGALFAQRPAATGLWLIGILVLLILRRRASGVLKTAREMTQRVRTDRFSATLEALFFTIVLTVWLPWVLIGIGLLLGKSPSASNASMIYAAGLLSAGQTLLFLNLFRQLCRIDGLACMHLNWHPALCENLSRQATWLMPIAPPLAFLVAGGAASLPSDVDRVVVAEGLDHETLVGLGRLAFVMLMLLLVVAVQRIWRRRGEVMTAFAASEDHAGWANYHLLWFGPSLLIPLSLAVATVLGYFYTSVFLAAEARTTLWFVVAAVIGKDLLFRGLYVTQRRLRFEEALRYRDEILAQRATDETASESPVDSVIKRMEEEKVDYRELGEQVRSLVQLGFTVSLIVGLWWIWEDVFPAFSFLNDIELPITTSRLVDGVTQDVPLTLSDMVAGLLLGGLALFAAMKVPAVLELTLLQRLPMSRASRYAITTLSQYVVAMVGVVITFTSLGLQWSSIQWLVAALSVGLGFGLQEIVANFISGIILLFEQPIRVGDVVTVDGTTGTVSKIRIRATTIVNWERQELVIPNKTFITGQLINWTLSDTVNRVMVTVGVGYDTDTRRAMRLMAEVAEDHPAVIDDPICRVSFEGFGDNALTLNMRAYLSDMDARLQTISELHQGILDKFREAGIEISFPQRDVHLSASEPIDLRMLRRQRAEPPGEG